MQTKSVCVCKRHSTSPSKLAVRYRFPTDKRFTNIAAQCVDVECCVCVGGGGEQHDAFLPPRWSRTSYHYSGRVNSALSSQHAATSAAPRRHHVTTLASMTPRVAAAKNADCC